MESLEYSLLKEDWLGDEETLICQSCSAQFNMTSRRHHCRMCGGVFCGNCSRFRLRLGNSFEESRVCENCYQKVAGYRSFCEKILPSLSNNFSFIRESSPLLYYANNKSPYTTYLWISERALLICFENIENQFVFYPVHQFIDVIEGQKSQEFLSRRSIFSCCYGDDISLQSEKCFSLIFSNKKTLDFQALNINDRMKWVSKFNKLLCVTHFAKYWQYSGPSHILETEKSNERLRIKKLKSGSRYSNQLMNNIKKNQQTREKIAEKYSINYKKK